MSGQIGEAKIDEVRERSDIVELVSQYVTLKRSGANHMGLCPFHSEKSPSFSVHAGRQFFHCFGCGVGGDVFSFLMKIEGLAFPDAVRRLAERAGIDLEERQLSAEEEQRQQQRERLYRANEVATTYFHQLLMEQPAGEPARQYLKQRGYGRKAAAEYQIGYATDTWEGLARHLQQQGIAAEDARALGLIRPGKQERGDYDLFRGRLIFPIYDLSGRAVAFGGRVLDDSKPKYINSPESPVYHKGRVLFGLYQARQAMRQSGEVIIVEGYFDQLALYRAGFPQVVATCGTALTAEHARQLKRYVQRVLLLFDQDAAGRQATFKAMAALQEEGVPASVIELPVGDDPDSFVQKHGREAFAERLGKARPAMDLFMEDALGEAGSAIEDRVRAAEKILARISALTSAMEQDLYLKDLAGRSGIELDLLKRKLLELGQKQKTPTLREDYRPPVPDAPPDLPPPPEDVYGDEVPVRSTEKPAKVQSWSRVEEKLLQAALLFPEERNRLAGIEEELFMTPAAVQLAQEIVASQRELADAALLEDFSAVYQQKVQEFLAAPKEMVEGTFDSLLAAVKKAAMKKRSEELRQQIADAERNGDENLQTKLQIEFTQLKKKLQL